MLYSYSVTPLKADHFEERCADIEKLHRDGVIYMPLFSMTLVPEGDPVWDKAGGMAALFARYRDALTPKGVPCGILVQASLGHGYKIEPNPFQNYVNLSDGEESPVCCPEDPAFIKHFQGVLKTLAGERPAAIMLDDDFRMIVRPGRGCVCPYHVKEFNRRSGKSFTRDELREHVLNAPYGDPLSVIFEETQRDSLVKAARAFREAIDEIDPSIQGINCTSGHYCDSVADTDPIFCGKGNPTMVRVPNGVYAPISVRGFSDGMRQAAICGSKLRRRGIEILLAETDTIPFNRYAKSAAYLHAHYTASILEGLQGAKHWLSRSSAFEPGSGRAYRAILAKYARFYDRLTELAKNVRWLGVNSAFIEQEHYCFQSDKYGSRWHSNDWATLVFERMGLPFRFSDDLEGATFLEGGLAADMTDEQIEKMFKGSVFTDAQSAEALIKRGFGRLLGVEISDEDRRISGECFDKDGTVCCTAQKNAKKLTVAGGAKALSYNYVNVRGKAKLLSPAVTMLEREGGVSVVFCGSPTAAFKYTEGFAFLNESRKKQFIGLFSKANALPVYAEGDEEICLRAGRLSDGALLVAAYPLGIDCADGLALKLEKPAASVSILGADGRFRRAGFSQTDGVCMVKTPVTPMIPVILKVKS